MLAVMSFYRHIILTPPESLSKSRDNFRNVVRGHFESSDYRTFYFRSNYLRQFDELIVLYWHGDTFCLYQLNVDMMQVSDNGK